MSIVNMDALDECLTVKSFEPKMVCRSCGRTVEVSGPAVEKWASAVAEQHGFREVSHDLEIFGTCSAC